MILGLKAAVGNLLGAMRVAQQYAASAEESTLLDRLQADGTDDGCRDLSSVNGMAFNRREKPAHPC